MGFLERILREPDFERRANRFVAEVSALSSSKEFKELSIDATNFTTELLSPIPPHLKEVFQKISGKTPKMGLNKLVNEEDRQSAFANTVYVHISGPDAAQGKIRSAVNIVDKIAKSRRGLKDFEDWHEEELEEVWVHLGYLFRE